MSKSRGPLMGVKIHSSEFLEDVGDVGDNDLEAFSDFIDVVSEVNSNFRPGKYFPDAGLQWPLDEMQEEVDELLKESLSREEISIDYEVVSIEITKGEFESPTFVPKLNGTPVSVGLSKRINLPKRS